MKTHGAAVNCCGERGSFVLVLPGHPVDLAKTGLLRADDQTLAQAYRWTLGASKAKPGNGYVGMAGHFATIFAPKLIALFFQFTTSE